MKTHQNAAYPVSHNPHLHFSLQSTFAKNKSKTCPTFSETHWSPQTTFAIPNLLFHYETDGQKEFNSGPPPREFSDFQSFFICFTPMAAYPCHSLRIKVTLEFHGTQVWSLFHMHENVLNTMTSFHIPFLCQRIFQSLSLYCTATDTISESTIF